MKKVFNQLYGIASIIGGQNFFLQFVFAKIVSHLFGMVKLMQIILMISMVNVVYSPHVNSFYQMFIAFADLDPMFT